MKTLIGAAAIALLLAIPSPAGAAETCPTSDGWTKIEDPSGVYDLDGATVRANDPKGVVTVLTGTVDLCVKGGTDIQYGYDLVAGDSVGPVKTPSGNDADVSHFSYRVHTPTTTSTTSTTSTSTTSTTVPSTTTSTPSTSSSVPSTSSSVPSTSTPTPTKPASPVPAAPVFTG